MVSRARTRIRLIAIGMTALAALGGTALIASADRGFHLVVFG